jgi:hypothetical protein
MQKQFPCYLGFEMDNGFAGVPARASGHIPKTPELMMSDD